jgi:hypothetical protein
MKEYAYSAQKAIHTFFFAKETLLFQGTLIEGLAQ